jgi:hypothetical protein
VVVNFDDYIAKLDDGSTFFVKGHDVTMVENPKKIQVVDLIGKFNENILLGSHQETRYCWWNSRIMDFIYISQPNLDVAMKKYGKVK